MMAVDVNVELRGASSKLILGHAHNEMLSCRGASIRYIEYLPTSTILAAVWVFGVALCECSYTFRKANITEEAVTSLPLRGFKKNYVRFIKQIFVVIKLKVFSIKTCIFKEYVIRIRSFYI